MAVTNGNVTISDGYKATYVASWAAFAPVSSATHIFSLSGSATKTIRVLRLGMSATRTTAGTFDIQINKLSSALTGGTPAAPTGIVPYDSTSAAATATALTYTANPTGGGVLVGSIHNAKLVIPTTAPVGAAQNEIIFSFCNNFSQDVVLRGTAQCIGLTFLGVTLTGGSVCIWVEWTEE